MIARFGRQRGAIAAICAVLAVQGSGLLPVAAESTGYTRVRAEGRADGTTPASRDTAIAAAKRHAVSMWLELLLGEAPDARFDTMIQQGTDYVDSARLVDLNTEAGETRVDIEAYMEEWPLRADAAALLFQSRSTPPAVAFLIDERLVHTNARHFQQACHAAVPLTEAFRKQRFRIVPPETIDQAYSDRELATLVDSPPDDIRNVGLEFGADTVVVLRCVIEVGPAESGHDLFDAHVDVAAQVIGVHDGRLHENVEAQAAVVCAVPEDGIRFAVDDAVYKLRDRVSVGAALAAEAGEREDLCTLTIEGVQTWLDVERIREHLEAQPGASEVSIVSARRGLGQIRFAYSGRMRPLVEALETGSDRAPGLVVRSVVDRELRFAMTN